MIHTAKKFIIFYTFIDLPNTKIIILIWKIIGANMVTPNCIGRLLGITMHHYWNLGVFIYCILCIRIVQFSSFMLLLLYVTS
jgi:hypothetical protein